MLLQFVGDILFQMVAMGQDPRVAWRVIVSWVISLLSLALFVRVLSSWLPVSPSSRWIRWSYVTDRLDDPPAAVGDSARRDVRHHADRRVAPVCGCLADSYSADCCASLELDGCVRFAVRVQPRASSTEIAGIYGDALKIRLAAPPVDGAANEALVIFLAKIFSVPRHDVRILAGESARSKLIEIRGITEHDVRDAATR